MAFRRVCSFVGGVVVAAFGPCFGCVREVEEPEEATFFVQGGGVEDLVPVEVFRVEPQAGGEEVGIVGMVLDETASLDTPVPEEAPLIPPLTSSVGEQEDPQFPEMAQPEAGPVEVLVPVVDLVLPEVGFLPLMVDLVLPDLPEGLDEEVIPPVADPAPALRRTSCRKRQPPVRLKSDGSREEVMKKIDEMRRTELYPRPEEQCNEVCQKRGCRNLRVIDSCWKLCIPHCMLSVRTEVQGSPLLNFPNVCTAEPKPGSVFCKSHHEILIRNGVPTDKKEFLRHIGCKGNPLSQEDIRRVDQQVLKFMDDLSRRDESVKTIETSATKYQVESIQPSLLNSDQDLLAKCIKDTGEKGRLRQRARGHFAAVSGGGNILCFNPIYKQCHFLQRDTKDAPTLTNAINLTWKRGGGLYCAMAPREVIELITMLDQELRDRSDHMRHLVEVAGQQADMIYAVNPDLFLGPDGTKIDNHNYVWLPDWPGAPGPLMYRQPARPYGLQALRHFLGEAEVVMGINYGSFILSLGAMVSMCNYKGIQEELGHFNLPVLYGPPMSGKTLAATCAAFVTGMTKNQISSRNTMAFLQELSISSTFPFLWDDPTKEADVRQIAIDLGNAAFRGKYKDGARTPQTGCLVTANFSLTEVEKYYSRICLIPFKRPETVHCGDGPWLEAKAAAASAAFPALLGIAATINRAVIREEVLNLQHQHVNLRIQEGIAVPAFIAKQILKECQLDTSVVDEVCQQVVAYHGRKAGGTPAREVVNTSTNQQKALEEARNKAQIGSVLRIHAGKLHVRVGELENVTGVRLREEMKARGVAICGKSFRFHVAPGLNKIYKCAAMNTESLSDSERTALEALTGLQTLVQEDGHEHEPLPERPATEPSLPPIPRPTPAPRTIPTPAKRQRATPSSSQVSPQQEPVAPEKESPDVQCSPTDRPEPRTIPTPAKQQRTTPSSSQVPPQHDPVAPEKESPDVQCSRSPKDTPVDRPLSKKLFKVAIRKQQTSCVKPLVGRKIEQKWKVGRKKVVYSSLDYSHFGMVTDLLSGKEGAIYAIYRVKYDCGDVEEIDLYSVLHDGSLRIKS